MRAQEDPSVVLDCGSDAATYGKDFDMVSGKPVAIQCTVKNTGSSDIKGMLLGKETTPQGIAATSTDVSLASGKATDTSLAFQPVFQNGTYQFTVSLLDMKNGGKALSREVTFAGHLGGKDAPKQARLLSAMLDKDTYDWGGSASLKLALDIPDGQKVAITVAMQKQDGSTCATLIDKQKLSQSEATLKFTFPKADQCINTLVLTLQDQGGSVVDKKALAVGLPGGSVNNDTGVAPVSGGDMAASSSGAMTSSRAVMTGVVLTVIIFIVLIGYFLVKRKRSL